MAKRGTQDTVHTFMQASKREEAQQRAAASLKRSREPTPEDGMVDASKRPKGEGMPHAAVGHIAGPVASSATHNTCVMTHCQG
jgi:hypothetical protein